MKTDQLKEGYLSAVKYFRLLEIKEDRLFSFR